MTGIVLIGGQSNRMGQPKALLEYHGKTLIERSVELLSDCCSNVYVSGKETQLPSLSRFSFEFIADKYPHIGPIAGIVSVFEADQLTNQPLLVLATDMPLVNQEILTRLLLYRNPQKLATMYQHPGTGFLEPLCAIYEPSAYFELKRGITEKEYSMQRILKREQLNILDIDSPDLLKNINTPEELERLL